MRKTQKVSSQQLLVKLLILAFTFNWLLLLPTAAFSQNVGVGINTTGSAANGSAILDVSSTTQGQLFPRMTTAQRNAIASPVESLLIYNTTTQCYEGYNASTSMWVSFGCIGGCQAPAQPSAITGTGTVCQGVSGVAYSVTNVTGISYTWTYSGTGYTIGSGSGTNSITANFSASATTGTLSVTGSNACGNSTASTLAIAVNNIPTSVTATANPTTLCSGNSLTLTASATGATGWAWSGPGSYTSGSQNPTAFAVTTSNTGIFTVTATNSCGTATSSTSSVTVNTIPTAVTVSGGGAICAGSTLNASGGTGGTIYWQNTTSGGTSTATPSTSQSMSSAGTYYFRANNSCGWGTQGSATVTIKVGGVQTSSCGGVFSYTDARSGGQGAFAAVQTGTGAGIQCWMAVNLNYGSYETLPITGSQPSGYKYCQNKSQNNDATCPMGGLYEWANLMNSSAGCNGCPNAPPCITPVQGLCPNGWHIPSHYEWTLLEKNVGSSPGSFPYDETTTGALGVDEGAKLKEVGQTYWWYTNTGTNTSGFTARGSGFTEVVGSTNQFVDGGYDCFLWSTTEGSDTSTAWGRDLYWGNNTVNRYPYNKALGEAVRCVRN